MATGGAVSLKALHQLSFVSCFSQNGRFQVGKKMIQRKLLMYLKELRFSLIYGMECKQSNKFLGAES